MASSFIKGLTVEIGGDTTELGKAIDSVNKKSKSLSSELGHINRLLKLNPKDTILLAQKQQVLAEAISNTEEKLGTLKEAEKQVQEQFARGEVSQEQVRALQRELVLTAKRLDGYKKSAEEVAITLEELGAESEDASGKVKKTAEASKEAEEAVDDLGDTLATAAKTGLGALVAAATAAVTAVVGLAESTREYRTEMGKLNAAFSAADHATVTATAAYKELYSVIGETDQSVEAAQQIALLAESTEDVTKWADLAAGVVGTFGDALQPETFYEAANETLKLGEATGAYVQMLEGVGMNVEEFNKGLADCNTEAEKQAYLLEVTEKALGKAGKEYKENNKDIIKANKATDDWNEALAQMGGEMEPIVTGLKEMGTSLLEDAQEPMKKTADFVLNKLLPALASAGNWTKQNLPQIGMVVAGLTATTVAYKAAVLSSEMATKGLTVATIAQQVAQKALNLVMNANPILLMATAAIGLTTALAALHLATKENVEPVDILTDEEKKLAEAAERAATAFQDQKEASQEAMASANAQMNHVQDLADELHSLADASGQVQEKDHARANFILGELNSALGTEYQMVDGVIQKYADLKSNIDAVIQSKRVNALLEAGNEAYTMAIQNEAAAMENLRLKQEEVDAQKAYLLEKEAEYTTEKEALQARLDAAYEAGNINEQQRLEASKATLEAGIKAHRDNLTEKEAALVEAAAVYGEYQNTISNYEDAMTASMEGNYDKAQQLLLDKGAAYGKYSDKVDSETAKVLDALYKEAIDAGIEAERMKANFENGVDGFTKEMVDEAEKGYQEAMDAYANAYADAESVGGDLGEGLAGGMENKRSSLYSKARSLVSGIISAMRGEADSHSPARKTIAFGEDVGEGAEIGIDNKTKDVEKAATRQAAAVLDAYSRQETAGQAALRRVADQQAAQRTSDQMSAANASNPLLERILTAIKEGHVLTIDGKALVGATADMTDAALGKRRAMVARGAM